MQHHLQRLAEGKDLQDIVQAGTAFRDLVRWQVLQPDVASGDGSAAGRDQRDQDAVDADAPASRIVDSRHQQHGGDAHDDAALHDAQRAGFQLQVVLEIGQRGSHHGDARQKAKQKECSRCGYLHCGPAVKWLRQPV